ncbi:GIY-YIG nuclease family protein [Streptomyces albidoflavus]
MPSQGSPGPTALYRFYDPAGELLYVGITQNPEVRWRAHKRHQLWWLDVDRKEVTWLETRTEAERAEREALQVERPRYDHTRAGFEGRGSTSSFKVPLADSYLESLVLATKKHLVSDLSQGVIPDWSILPPAGALAVRHGVSYASVDHALRRLRAAGTLSASGLYYVSAPAPDFPTRMAKTRGPVYVVAAHHFPDGPFTIAELMPYVSLTREAIAAALKKLRAHGFVALLDSRTGAYCLSGAPASP